MKKNTIKYLLDVTMFIDLCSITVIGFLLGFIIPGGGAGDKYFLGLHRHDWGDIHLYLSIFFMILLFIHIWFNWLWIVNTTKKHFGEKWKKFLWIVSAGWIIVLFVGWVAVHL